MDFTANLRQSFDQRRMCLQSKGRLCRLINPTVRYCEDKHMQENGYEPRKQSQANWGHATPRHATPRHVKPR